MAEANLGRPVYIIEVLNAWNANFYTPNLGILMVAFAIQDLFQNDELLANQDDLYSANPANQRSALNPNSKFELFSDRYARLFSKYELDTNLRLRCSDETPTLNFETLK